jgi:hypothetical protein
MQSVPITTDVVGSTPTQGEEYNIIWLSVTCDRSVIFSRSSVSSTNKTDPHDITEILLKEALSFYMLSQRFFIPASVFPHDCPWVSDVRITLIIMIAIPCKTFFQNENVQDIVLRHYFITKSTDFIWQ